MYTTDIVSGDGWKSVNKTMYLYRQDLDYIYFYIEIVNGNCLGWWWWWWWWSDDSTQYWYPPPSFLYWLHHDLSTMTTINPPSVSVPSFLHYVLKFLWLLDLFIVKSHNISAHTTLQSWVVLSKIDCSHPYFIYKLYYS